MVLCGTSRLERLWWRHLVRRRLSLLVKLDSLSEIDRSRIEYNRIDTGGDDIWNGTRNPSPGY